MYHFRKAGLALLTMLLLSAGSAFADSLTEQDVKNFISSLTELDSMEGELADLTDEMNNDYDSNNPSMPDLEHLFSDAVGRMEGHPQFERFEEVVEDNGFSSAADWGATGDRVFRAWMAIEMQGQSSASRQEMAKAMAEIDNNPNMSAEQKAQMRQMMQGAISMMEQVSQAPEADIRALRPHLDELRRVTND
ncbi:hypothetical protein [Marinobacter zhejiangensis]|uniref:DUF2059 domain-containing protein n=1 Tax=Marinobacter zhejiangensis TaxID=488535 RepID=A0A1I4M2Y1_9GAMM|nr:hypothetical protein [Marinobacter zhejiangensis]SFL97564.1 hypothetical protein SAMN04487963_0817 [Marinobacter zhejiangensis]